MLSWLKKRRRTHPKIFSYEDVSLILEKSLRVTLTRKGLTEREKTIILEHVKFFADSLWAETCVRRDIQE